MPVATSQYWNNIYGWDPGEAWPSQNRGKSMDEFYEVGRLGMWWLGQMGLIIKAGDRKICIDYFASPMESRQTPPPIPADELKDVSLFIGTHDHIDHIDHEAWKIWAKTNPNARFIFPRKHMKAVLADGVKPENAIGVDDDEVCQIGDIRIHAIAAAHEILDRDPGTWEYSCLQYIIEVNGFRIHHAGDTTRYEGMLLKLRRFGKIDVQLLPINGRDAKRLSNDIIGNMTYQEAADLAGDCDTELVIPGHWDMFAENSADPEAFADYVNIKYKGKIQCLIPKVMQKIELIKNEKRD